MSIKTYFLPANLRFDLKHIEPHIEKLPGSVGLVTTIQYLSQVKEVHELLKKRGKHSVLLGQVLGCNQDVLKKAEDFEAFFYVGSGRFHPIGIGLISEKPIFTYNPETRVFKTFDRTSVQAYQRKKKGLLAKFLHADHVGVLVSVKEGQLNIHDIDKAKKHFPEKKFYIFACNTLNYNELENYPFIDTWMNTMCPRIGTDDHEKVGKGMINIADLRPLMRQEQ